MRSLYTALFYTCVPLILGRLVWRGHKSPAYRQRWGERFGLYTKSAQSGVIWLHAVSVGEAEAAFPLVRALSKRFPNIPVLVTNTTPTGSARVRAVLGDTVQHVYLPYDLPDAIARFLNHFRPVLAVVMETEIWPNLFRACHDRNIPLAIVNARLSERSVRGYERLPALARESLHAVTCIAAQTQADADRYLQIGALAQQVVVTGNLKYDQELPQGLLEQAKDLRTRLFGTRPVWIAGSTHDGEENAVLEAFKQVRGDFPNLLLVLVPRHPERFDSVHTLCSAHGLKTLRRSEERTDAETDVFLVDTMGELRLFYAASDIAFVGGSLVPVGGHNVLEPAMLGVPVAFGPHMHNFQEIALKLLETGGAVRIANSTELADWAKRLLSEPALREEMAEKGKSLVTSGRGALARVEALVASLLENPSPS